MANRKDITPVLTKAVVNYYSKIGFSSYTEIGVLPWGKRRLDVLALNTKALFIGVEVKSCWADYASDSKWKEYLEFVNKFYFCFPQSMYDNKKQFNRILEAVKPEGVGIMVLSEISGRIKIVRNASKRKVSKQNKTKLIIKMAWRGGCGRHNVSNVYERLFIESSPSGTTS